MVSSNIFINDFEAIFQPISVKFIDQGFMSMLMKNTILKVDPIECCIVQVTGYSEIKFSFILIN